MDTTRKSLLLRIKDPSDVTAWREFDEIYRPLLRKYALYQRLSDADADDITQQCMAAIHARIAEFDYDPKKGGFRRWLRTMVNNKVRNLWRDRRERQADSDLFRGLPDDGAADAMFDQLWQHEHVKYCLRLIRPEIEDSTWRAFHAYVIEERPVDEVCRTLGMTTNQVHLIKWRVTRMMSERVRDLSGEDD